jgi:hypothetical protein
LGLFIVLVFQIEIRRPVVGILAGDMFNDCHRRC